MIFYVNAEQRIPEFLRSASGQEVSITYWKEGCKDHVYGILFYTAIQPDQVRVLDSDTDTVLARLTFEEIEAVTLQ